MVVLSSDVAIKDLLDKKGGIYSDRPDMYLSQDVASGGLRLVVMVRYIVRNLLALAAMYRSDFKRCPCWMYREMSMLTH